MKETLQPTRFSFLRRLDVVIFFFRLNGEAGCSTVSLFSAGNKVNLGEEYVSKQCMTSIDDPALLSLPFYFFPLAFMLVQKHFNAQKPF